MARMVRNLPAMQQNQVQSLSQEDPLEKGMATHSVSSCLANSIFTQLRVCRRATFLCQFEEGGEESIWDSIGEEGNYL